ncbi:Uncharacterised protein [Mycobacteroides abscessus]|nr:Uncharacterised protein [Mycobacteroides abscessus]
MPRPSSSTRSSTISPAERADTRTVPPGGENFTALLSRLVSICTTRSPSTATTSSVSSCAISTPASRASSPTGSAAVATRSATRWSARSSGVVPESMRSMSRMSSTIRLRRSLLDRATCTMRAERSGSVPRAPLSSRPSAPRIAVSGVRSSWLTTDTNSSLSRSTSRRSVMSRNTTTAPSVRPSSLSGLAVTSTATSEPSSRR